MINVQDFYDRLLVHIRKDVRGKGLSIDDFNDIAPIVNSELFEYFYGKFQETKKITDSLSPFLVTGESLTITSNKGDLSATTNTYRHLVGSPRYSTSTVVDVVTMAEYSERYGDSLTAPSTSNPVCYIAQDTTPKLTLFVYPSGVTPLLIDYIKEPDTPFLDYYINDTTYVVTYMDEADTGVSIPSGSTYRDGTAGATTKDSATYNFDFNEEDEPLLMAMFLDKLGIQFREPEMIQYANMQQNKLASDD